MDAADHGHALALALRSAYWSLHRHTDRVLAKVGVTADQFVLLAALAEGESPRQRELVARTAFDPNTLRAMLALLEHRGLVRRRRNPTDRRARQVALTSRGRQVLAKAWRHTIAIRDHMLAALAPHPPQALTTLLELLAASLAASSRHEAKRRPPAATLS